MRRRQIVRWRWFVVAPCLADGGFIPAVTCDFFSNGTEGWN